MMPFDDFQHITDEQKARARAEFRDAFNNSMAGRETGRMDVAFVGEAAQHIETRKRKERLNKLLVESALDTLLRDPVYRARWEGFGNFLSRYAEASRAAIERARDVSAAAHDAVRDALNNAHMLDGNAVFETDDGRYVYQGGTEIDPAQADRIVRSKDAVSYSDFLLLEQSAANADAAISQIKRYQNDLEAAEQRRTSRDNPYETPEAMDADEQRLKEVAPDSVREILNAPEIKIRNTVSPTTGAKPAV